MRREAGVNAISKHLAVTATDLVTSHVRHPHHVEAKSVRANAVNRFLASAVTDEAEACEVSRLGKSEPIVKRKGFDEELRVKVRLVFDVCVRNEMRSVL